MAPGAVVDLCGEDSDEMSADRAVNNKTRPLDIDIKQPQDAEKRVERGSTKQKNMTSSELASSTKHWSRISSTPVSSGKKLVVHSLASSSTRHERSAALLDVEGKHDALPRPSSSMAGQRDQTIATAPHQETLKRPLDATGDHAAAKRQKVEPLTETPPRRPPSLTSSFSKSKSSNGSTGRSRIGSRPSSFHWKRAEFVDLTLPTVRVVIDLISDDDVGPSTAAPSTGKKLLSQKKGTSREPKQVAKSPAGEMARTPLQDAPVGGITSPRAASLADLPISDGPSKPSRSSPNRRGSRVATPTRKVPSPKHKATTPASAGSRTQLTAEQASKLLIRNTDEGVACEEMAAETQIENPLKESTKSSGLPGDADRNVTPSTRQGDPADEGPESLAASLEPSINQTQTAIIDKLALALGETSAEAGPDFGAEAGTVAPSIEEEAGIVSGAPSSTPKARGPDAEAGASQPSPKPVETEHNALSPQELAQRGCSRGNDAPDERSTVSADAIDSLQEQRKDQPTNTDIGSFTTDTLPIREDKELSATAGGFELEPPLGASISEKLRSTASLLILPLSNRVELTLGKYLENRRSDNENRTRTVLSQARLRVDELGKAGRDASQSAKSFSFDSMKAQQTPVVLGKSVYDAPGIYTVERVSSSGTKIVQTNFKAPITAFKTVDTQPCYSRYVEIVQNFIAPNVVNMHCEPYFDDEFDLSTSDTVEAAYKYDIDSRERKLRRLLHARSYEEYVEKYLDEFGIDWSDLLRYILETSPDVGGDPDARRALATRDDVLDEDFSRSSKRAAIVLSSLPMSTPAKLAKAGMLCDTFKKLTECTLWHVARLHQFDLVPADDPRLDADVSIKQLTCRICFRVSCHYHGEFEECYEESEADSSSENSIEDGVGRDIIHPPNVNSRKPVGFPVHSRNDVPLDRLSLDSPPLDLDDRRRVAYWETFDFKQTNERGVFYPCHHPGFSCDDADCSCYTNMVMCEKFCSCSKACERKFQGCSCSDQKRRKGRRTCWDDQSCACYMNGRECDPELCGSCGVGELIDTETRHHDRPEKACNNANMQYGIAKHTVLGDSPIHGFGLYAGETMYRHDFVGEYKGEVITNAEGNRRSAVRGYQDMTYLFSLNIDQEIDSTYYGNKLRFINHRAKEFNLYARTMLVNSTHRIAMFAERTIQASEELFFDYGEKFPAEQLGGDKESDEKSALTSRNAKLGTTRDELSHRGATKGIKRGRPSKSATQTTETARTGRGVMRKSTGESTLQGGEDEEDTAAGSTGEQLAACDRSDELQAVDDEMEVDAASSSTDEEDVFEPDGSDTKSIDSQSADSDFDIELPQSGEPNADDERERLRRRLR